jgi:hypothetical protein
MLITITNWLPGFVIVMVIVAIERG